MSTDNSIKKLESFFEDNIKVKTLMNNMFPDELDFFSDDSMFKYVDRLSDCLNKIELYINKMLLNYNLSNDIMAHFEETINNLQQYFKSESFYQLCKQRYNSVLKFIHTNIGNMRPEFVESVQQNLFAYNIFYGKNILTSTTINEFLHYIHKYIVNNTNFYFSFPIIKSINENEEWGIVTLRGISNSIGNKVYEGIVFSNIDATCIDIVNLNERMFILARDLGHATVIELDFEDGKIFVRYYIPKNTNMEKTSKLKGINTNKKEFATGKFLTTEENLVDDLCSLMKGIPTDFDIVIPERHHM